MMEPWIVRMSRERSQRHLGVCLLALLVEITFICTNRRYFGNLLNAPYATSSSEPGIWFIVVGSFYFIVFAGLGVRAWRRLQDVNRNPLVRRFYGWADPTAVSNQAEQELEIATRFKSHGVFITDDYAILKTFLRFRLFRFDDLLWLFSKTEYRLIHFIPVGRKHSVHLVFYGGEITFRARRKIVHQVLSFAVTRSPWAFLGYSQKLAARFHKETNEFCLDVERKRQQLAAKTQT
jgi:hypothetical protein